MFTNVGDGTTTVVLPLPEGLRYSTDTGNGAFSFVETKLPTGSHTITGHSGQLTGGDAGDIVRIAAQVGPEGFGEQGRSGHFDVLAVLTDNQGNTRTMLGGTESFHISSFGNDQANDPALQTFDDDEFGENWRINELNRLVPYDGNNLDEVKRGLRHPVALRYCAATGLPHRMRQVT